jgi:cell wall-associated NlpC family hydrolase
MNNFIKQFVRTAVDWAKSSVPYQHRGISRNGCDCTGLLIGVAKENGYLKNYILRKYPPDWNIHRQDNHVINQLKIFADKIENKEAAEGDIIVMDFGKSLSHCGILVNKKKMLMVHCYVTTKKVSFAILRNSRWFRRWKETYRINENKILQYK